MPEAAVDEDGEAMSREHDVGIAPDSVNRFLIDTKSQSARMQSTAERELGSGIHSLLRDHSPSGSSVGGRRSWQRCCGPNRFGRRVQFGCSLCSEDGFGYGCNEHMREKRGDGIADLAALRGEAPDELVAVRERLEAGCFSDRESTILERVCEASRRHVVELRRDGVGRQRRIESAEKICAIGAAHPAIPVREHVGWDLAPGPARWDMADEFQMFVRDGDRLVVADR